MNNLSNIQLAGDEFEKIFQVPAPVLVDYNQLLNWISLRVNILLTHDFSALVRILYRMDVSEEKLRYMLKINKGEMASPIIAALMIEREMKKIETRRLYKKNEDIPEEERW